MTNFLTILLNVTFFQSNAAIIFGGISTIPVEDIVNIRRLVISWKALLSGTNFWTEQSEQFW